MRVQRYHYKKRKIINTGMILPVIGLAAVLLFLKDHEKFFSEIKKEFQIVCYEEMLDFSMPGIVYEAKGGENESVVKQLFVHFFPIGDYTAEVKEYPTQVESSLSYETILAREAADENYVDEETGEVVIAGNPAEDSGMPDISGVEVKTEESGTGTTAGETQPAGETQAAAGQPSQEPASQAAAGTASGKVVSYSREKLNDFDYLVQNFYQVDNTTTITGSQLNADSLLGKDMRLSHDASTPQVLIYHTHSQEGYADSVPGDMASSVVGVGDYLTKLLTEQYGMNVIHHKGQYDVGDRDHAYSRAGPALEQVLAENPSIEVVIDLHRDGVREDTRLVTNLNGVEMAQIMFFNGLSRTTSTGDIGYLYNPYIADNLAISFQMQLNAAEYYPGFTRRIYLKGYRYNMHYRPKTLLIEVGAQTNTLQEAMNSMVPLADILNKVLTGAQQH